MTKRPIWVAAATMVTLAGCAAAPSSSAPRVLPPATHTASRTVTAGAASSSLTAEQAAVEEAVRHYFAVANQALATGNVAPLEALSLPGCGCRELISYIRTTYAANRRPIGAHFSVRRISLHDLTDRSVSALVDLSMNAYNDVDANGHVVQHYPAERGQEDMTLVLRNTSWAAASAVSLPQ